MILVTGSAGYIGSHCVLDLLNNGYDVAILDNLSTGHIETVERLKSYAESTKGKIKEFFEVDLTDEDKVNNVFKNNKFDAVIHFAAASLVNESVINPRKYYHNNVLGTLNLLNAMVDNDCKNIVFSSTCATYGEPDYSPMDEKHPQKPINPYGHSKLAIEFAIKDYAKAYGLKHAIFRYFNVIGASCCATVGEWHDIETHLIPNILKAKEDKIFSLFGDDYATPDGTCVRDYIDVNDLVIAHRFAYEHLLTGGDNVIINLGSENGASVKEVFDSVESALDRKIPLKICEKREGDPATLICNANLAKQVLNWQTNVPLDNSIKNAHNWEIELEKIKKGQNQ